MNIRIGLGTIGSDPGPTVTKEGDSMVIDCRDCRLTPVPGSDECVRCMVSAMHQGGRLHQEMVFGHRQGRPQMQGLQGVQGLRDDGGMERLPP